MGILLLSLLLCACKRESEEEKVTIVCTSFPAYDWVVSLTKGISSENHIEICWLGDNGQDLHFYQPSVDDVVKIKESSMLVVVGGSLDPWVLDSVSAEKSPLVVSMMEVVGDDVYEEELVEGMEAEEEDEVEYDEHVWMSLAFAKRIVCEIEKNLEVLFPEDEEVIKENYYNYIEDLQALEKDYLAMRKEATLDTILVADRFPFRYLVEEWGISYYAAFPGCSSETDASFETIIFLADKVNDLHLPYVFVTEGSTEVLAQRVLEVADSSGEVLVLNAMQTIGKKEGETYLSIMEKNLGVLTKALNR